MSIRTRALVTGLVAAFMGCSESLAIADGERETLQNRSGSILWKLGTNIRSGTIISMSSTRMVVARIHKGRSEQIEFLLNSETVRTGEIVVGAQVTVHYRTTNSHNIATSIQTRKQLVEVP